MTSVPVLHVRRGGARVPVAAGARGPLAVVKLAERAWSVFHILTTEDETICHAQIVLRLAAELAEMETS